MALSQRLQMRQSQALVMTPQLMQAIKLLQLSNLDLVAYVEGELEKNPLLERASEDEPGRPETEPGEPETGSDGAASDRASNDATASLSGDELETSRAAIEERLDTDLDNVFPDDAAPTPPRANGEQPAAYSEWGGTGSGGRADGDYNLEA